MIFSICCLIFGFYSLHQYSQVPVCSNNLASSSSDSIDENTNIIVEISGAIEKPGVYDLQRGQRVSEVLEMAGGLSTKADFFLIQKNINLSRIVFDGEKIYFPFQNEITETSNQINNDNFEIKTKLSLNNSSKEELMSIKGIGEVKATQIINLRPITSLNMLVENRILSETQLASILNDVSL